MPRKTVEEPSPIDIHLGKVVRARRLALGLSQAELSEPLGLSWQQVWKYENGSNRITAARLFEIAGLLKMSVAEFFDGIDPATHQAIGMGELVDFFATSGAAELARAYLRMTPHQRSKLVELAEVIPPN